MLKFQSKHRVKSTYDIQAIWPFLEKLREIVMTARREDKNLIMVTNEVGMCVVSPYRMSRIFSDINGKANEMLASLSDEVYLSVCGIPMQLK